MISDVGGCSVFSLDQVFVDQIFRIFDKDGNGSIDFKVLFAKNILGKPGSANN